MPKRSGKLVIMSMNDEKSLSDEATFAGRVKPPSQSRDVSLGDERTLGDAASGQDTVIDDVEVVDLEARYRVEGTLGQSGMGCVLLATDTRLERKVAIKRILGEAAGNRMSVQRFLTEARAIAALNHPNIIQIYDYGRAKDGPFLIMEYVDGGSLLDRCKESALPLDEAIGLACQVCDGLAKAHDVGITHRDIKPANVLLTKDGIPKLMDFGLAKAQAGDHGQTMTGAVMGTPDFMPPEQRRDASEVDHRSDLWSLAATVYQMVTGRSPKVIRLHELPQALQAVMARALEDAKEARYQSAREFRDALKTSRQDASGLRRQPTQPKGEMQEGQCKACGTVTSDLAKKFCRNTKCGAGLRVACLKCEALIPVWDGVCGECGGNQPSLAKELREDAVRPRHRPSDLPAFLAETQAEARRSATIALVSVARTVFYPSKAGILDVSAEGVCYSANNNLVFGGGASDAVLRAAGPRLGKAAARIIRDEGPIPVGSCTMTDAYDLVQNGCHKIFHLATLAFDPLSRRYEPRGKDHLYDISRAVASACHSATEAGLGSLAMPQLGARVGGLSADQAAAAVVRGVHAFLLKEASNRPIQKLYLCAFHSDIALSAFAKQLHLVRYQSGDILSADTEAIVVSANNWLVSGSGTAKAVADRGGEELATAIRALQKERCPLDLGTAVELPGGRIQDAQRGNRKRLYYAVSLGYHRFDGRRAAGRIPATPESVYDSVVTTLRMASACTVRSIAFPLMAARPGYSTVPEQAAPRVMLRAMITAINDIRPELTMERIAIYLPPRHMLLAEEFVLSVAEGRIPLQRQR